METIPDFVIGEVVQEDVSEEVLPANIETPSPAIIETPPPVVTEVVGDVPAEI